MTVRPVRLALMLAFGMAASNVLAQSQGPLKLGVAVSGVVEKVFVRDGAHVAAGDQILHIDCGPLEAEFSLRTATLAAAQAAYERTRNGFRPDEIAIGEAAVGVARARAEEARDAFNRLSQLREGVSTTRAALLQAQRDARITAAQLVDAQRKLDLLHAGSREEDIRENLARRDAAEAAVTQARANVDRCAVRAPVPGTVKVLVTLGQFVSVNVPATLAELTPDSR